MNNTMRHYGIPGMKWGVRRFQNKDGSLKPAGEKRYNSDGASNKKAEKDKKPSLSERFKAFEKRLEDKEIASYSKERQDAYKKLTDDEKKNIGATA